MSLCFHYQIFRMICFMLRVQADWMSWVQALWISCEQSKLAVLFSLGLLLIYNFTREGNLSSNSWLKGVQFFQENSLLVFIFNILMLSLSICIILRKFSCNDKLYKTICCKTLETASKYINGNLLKNYMVSNM